MQSQKDHSSASELDLPIWSVVSFERREARSLSYDDAIEKIRFLEEQKVPGLCIVTDEAADRIAA
jgi:hypothetical protein